MKKVPGMRILVARCDLAVSPAHSFPSAASPTTFSPLFSHFFRSHFEGYPLWYSIITQIFASQADTDERLSAEVGLSLNKPKGVNLSKKNTKSTYRNRCHCCGQFLSNEQTSVCIDEADGDPQLYDFLCIKCHTESWNGIVDSWGAPEYYSQEGYYL